eukprot:NODE_332_length_1879_cov_80.527869_g239_i0.p1 GENE.NODE_332_length_1879_cov_80.527869_g239_i0~~NODE_332_length_1879_cov_80.527869_g239_i0.p1  ORF type:complete len:574 (+),score=116.57 NODE_332_length_1879_cov_80.527869_g239_i0:60-1781(+)
MNVQQLLRLIGNTTIFSDVNFTTEAGDTLFVVGPSGAGKSTMLRALARLDQVTGTITLQASGGQLLSPQQIGATAWRAEVSYVTQARVTCTGTPRSLFHLAQTFKAQTQRHTCHLLLDDVAGQLGLTSENLDQVWGTLSGGQAQRALLTVCLALAPRVLLLDEPTSALDPASAEAAEVALTTLLPDSMRVWVSHDPAQPSRVGGRILEMKPYDKGEIPVGLRDSSSGATGDKGGENRALLRPAGPTMASRWRNLQLFPVVAILLVTLLFVWEGFDLPGYDALVGTGEETAADASLVEISTWLLIGTMLAMLAIIGVASHVLHLGVLLSMTVSACRTVLQLSILSWILVPIFQVNSPWLVITYVFVMMLVAAYEACKRPKFVYNVMILHILVAIVVSTSITTGLGVSVGLDVGLDARYAIPMVGMLLGNVMTSTSLSITNLLTQLGEHPENTELLLSLGASRWEALFKGEVVSSAVSVGITPTIQAMAVLGIVAIPGMMTGQILGGSPPIEAARYQMLIMFLIAANSIMGMVIAVALASSHIIDPQHRLRRDRIFLKDKKAPWYKPCLCWKPYA